MTSEVIIFYKYIHIDDPKALMKSQRVLCESLGLRGRTIIAHEGINATYEGTTENLEKYIAELRTDPRFTDVFIKRSPGTGHDFPKLSIKVRNEIVTLGLGAHDDINPNETTGTHLKPEELKQWYEQGKEFVVVDMRNDYEFDVGRFKGSILPSLKNFRDLKEKVGELEQFKDKTVLTVCTFGVRCEKASGFLKKSGFQNVYQLDGGIGTYLQTFKDNKEFAGALYTFDKRKVIAFSDNREVIGKCFFCKAPTETYTNCSNVKCNRHFLVCSECDKGDRMTRCATPQCDATIAQPVPSL